MGEAKRRRDQGKQAPGGIKISPRKREAGFLLAHHNRFERQADDGTVFATNVFRVVSLDGDTMVEETPDGPMPVLVMSVAQPVRKAVIAASAALVGVR